MEIQKAYYVSPLCHVREICYEVNFLQSNPGGGGGGEMDEGGEI